MTVTAITDAPTTRGCIRRPGSVWTVCTCERCLTLQRRARKSIKLGRRPQRATDQAWERIDHALTLGWSERAIATAIGIPLATIHGALLIRRQTGIASAFTYANTAAILAPWSRPAAGTINIAGTRRRIQALCAIGYSTGDISKAVGIARPAIGRFRGTANSSSSRQVPQTISVRHHFAIADVYARISNTPGPAPHLAEEARERGWATPAAWDDDSIDNPTAHPDGRPTITAVRRAAATTIDDVAIQRALAGDTHAAEHLTRSERREAVRIAARHGLTDGHIGELIGMTARNVLRVRRAAGIATHYPTPNRHVAAVAS